MNLRLKEMLHLKIKRVKDITPYTKNLYVITRENHNGDSNQLGYALSNKEAQIIFKWLNSINSYYDEEQEEWIIE